MTKRLFTLLILALTVTSRRRQNGLAPFRRRCRRLHICAPVLPHQIKGACFDLVEELQ